MRKNRHHENGPWEGRRFRSGPPGGGFGGPFGPGGPLGPDTPFGQGGPFGPGGPRRGHGPRGRGRGRGDTRAAILLLLEEQPRHGYELIGEITERSQGGWNPSPGSVYPALQALEDEGLVTISADAGRRVGTLTAAGQEYVAAHRSELGTPWAPENFGTPPDHTMRRETRAVMDAAMQVTRVGTPAQTAAAVALLQETRRALYRLLAEDVAE